MTIDAYWIAWIISPVFWGALLPFLGFEMGYLISGKNHEVGLVAASMPIFFPKLIWRGAISTPFAVGTVLFFFLFFFLSVHLQNKTKGFFIVAFVFLIAILNIHPLIGIPILGLFIWILMCQLKNRLRKPAQSKSARAPRARRTLISWVVLSMLLLSLTIASLGLLDLLLYGKLLGLFEGLVVPPLLSHFFPFWFTPDIGWQLNLVYFFARDIFLFQLVLVGIGLFYARKVLNQDWVTFSVTLVAFLLSFSVLTVSWTYFPPERFFIMFGITILPLAAYGIVSLKQKIKSLRVIVYDNKSKSYGELHKSQYVKAVGITLVVLLISTTVLSLYGAYPKFHPPIETGGAHPNIYDFQAIKFIEENTGGSYVVLSDGIAASAAIATFGWRRYNSRPWICYYPPTISDPDPFRMYQYNLFLDMMWNPSPKPMELAMYYGHTKEAYFVLSPPRWWSYDTEKIRLKSEAIFGRPFFEVEGKIYVFRYSRPPYFLSGVEGVHEAIDPIYLKGNIQLAFYGFTIMNMLPNPSFEINTGADAYPDGWLYDFTHIANSTWEWDSISYHGSKSFKIAKTNDLGYSLLRPADYISISPNETYSASVYYKTDKEEIDLSLIYAWYTESRAYIGYNEIRFAGSTEWAMITLENERPPQNAKLLRLDLRIWTQGTVWFDAVQLEMREYASKFIEEEMKHTENPSIFNAERSINVQVELAENQSYVLTSTAYRELLYILSTNFTIEAEGSGSVGWELSGG